MKTQKTYKAILSMKQSIMLAFVLFITNILFAQTGSLSGAIKDSEGELLFGAIVQVKGTKLGAQSDFDGNYFIQNIPVGPQVIIFDYMGDAKEVELTITTGDNTHDYQFGQSEILLPGVIIQVEKDEESDVALQEEQLNNNQQVENIGVQEMETKGVGNVADGVTKIAGVSKVGSGRVFVRGLGDRYNNAFLNGLPIASPNPDLKVIPLDLFPTSIVKYISVSKVFDEKYYADYAGASIDIQTKTYTDTVGFFKVGLSGKMNTVSTFKDFYTHKDGQVEFLGIDGGNRDLPEAVQPYDAYNFPPNVHPEDNPAIDYDNYGNTFGGNENPYTTSLTPSLQKALPGMGISLSAGKFFAFRDKSDTVNTYKDKNRGIGFLLSMSTSNDYKSVFGGISRQYSTQSTILTDFDYNKHSLVTSSSIIGSVIYKLNAKNNISYSLLYVNDTENAVRENEGYSQDLGRDIYSRRNAYTVNSLLNNQILGEHDGNKMDIEWGVGYGEAGSQEKDRKELVFFSDPTGYTLNELNVAGNNRLWSALNENEISGKVAAKFHIFKKDSLGNSIEEADAIRGNIKVGVNYRHKERGFDYKQFNYKISDLPTLQGGETVDIYQPDNYLNTENAESGTYNVLEQKDPSSLYEAQLDIMAAYAGIDYDLSDKFKILGGLRLEKANQLIFYKQLGAKYSSNPDTVQIDTFNVFPSIGFKYSPKEKTNIRFAASQTVTRPGFKEVAPFLNQSYFGGPTSQGNTDLRNSYNYNADLKYEKASRPGELASVTIFARYIDDPIERIAQASSSTILSFENIESAVLSGIEFEVSKNLASLLYPKIDSDSLDSWTKNVSGGANFSYMYSEISIPKDGSFIVTNNKRQLQGASPYLLNFDASYNLETGSDSSKVKTSTTFTLTYNVFGKRVFAAGVLGAEDIYEMSVNTLDFVVKSSINERLSIGLKAKNLLNPTIRLEQKEASSDRQLTINSYKRGVSFSLSLGYKF